MVSPRCTRCSSPLLAASLLLAAGGSAAAHATPAAVAKSELSSLAVAAHHGCDAARSDADTKQDGDRQPGLPASNSSSSSDALDTRVWAIDDMSRCIELAQPAKRVVSLSPHATELLYAAGGGPHMIGVDNASDYPPAAASLPRLGSGLQTSPESLLVASPDLVVTWQPGHLRHLPAGVQAFVSTPHRMAEIPATVRKFGSLMGTAAQADAAANTMEQRLASLVRQHADSPPIRVFVEIGMPPYYTVNGAHIISDMLALCGASNVYADAKAASPRISVEGVLAAQPQAVLVARTQESTPPPLPLALTHLPRIEVDADHLFRPGPRMFDAAETTCQALDALRQAAQH